jgi:CBS domain-containing protein
MRAQGLHVRSARRADVLRSALRECKHRKRSAVQRDLRMWPRSLQRRERFGGSQRRSQSKSRSFTMKKVSDVMTREIHLATPDQSIASAAAEMAKADVGSLPVSDADRLVGMITDRDIAVRAVAKGLGAETPVRNVMTGSIKYCYEDQDVDEVARNMAELGVRRLPVVNRDKRLVGFVALSNIVHTSEGHTKDTLLRGVATPH